MVNEINFVVIPEKPGCYHSFIQSSNLLKVEVTNSRCFFTKVNITSVAAIVQDYLDSETRYHNDVIVSLRFG